MKRWVWYGALLLAVIFYKITWRLLLPFLLALVIATALQPVVTWINRRTPLGRTAATVLVFAIFALLGTGLAFWASAAVVQSVALFIDGLPEYQAAFSRMADNFLAWTSGVFGRVPPEVLQWARSNIDQVIQTANSLLTQLSQAVLNGLSALPGLASIMLISALAGFFLTKDWKWFTSGLLNLLPVEWRRTADKTGSKVGKALGRYVLAQLSLMGISTVLSLIGLIIIGVDRWFAAGLVGGVLDLLPVLGPGLLYVPWAIYAFFVGQSMFGISLLVLYLIVIGSRQMLEAKVVGQSLGIHPFIMIAGLYCGVILLGAKGLILAPVVLIIGKAYIDVSSDRI